MKFSYKSKKEYEFETHSHQNNMISNPNVVVKLFIRYKILLI